MTLKRMRQKIAYKMLFLSFKVCPSGVIEKAFNAGYKETVERPLQQAVLNLLERKEAYDRRNPPVKTASPFEPGSPSSIQ